MSGLQMPSPRNVDPHLVPGDLVIMPELCPTWKRVDDVAVIATGQGGLLWGDRQCLVLGVASPAFKGPDTHGGVALFFCPQADDGDERLFWAEVLYVKEIVARA